MNLNHILRYLVVGNTRQQFLLLNLLRQVVLLLRLLRLKSSRWNQSSVLPLQWQPELCRGLLKITGLSQSQRLSLSRIVSGTFEDNRIKSEPKTLTLKSVEILGLGIGPEIEKKLKYAEVVSSGVIFGKELVNAPANVLTPGVLTEEAKKIAYLYSDSLTATILDVEQCKELKMRCFLGVAAASANPPHFIHLCYKPLSGSVKTKLALLGKGITFDSS